MVTCDRVTVRAPGKINLSLEITGKLPDGYHAVDTVMQAVDLCDTVVVGKCSGGEIRVTCSRPGVPEDGENVAHKAAVLFFARLGLPVQGLDIHIRKSIPVQAGLGGGSADAAAVIVALDRLYGAGLGEAALREIGEQVGADVPFCISGGTRRARGKGELLTELPPLPDCTFVLAKPSMGVSTVHAFSLYDRFQGEAVRSDTAAMVRAIEAGDLAGVGRRMSNVFEQVTKIDEVEPLKGVMLAAGAAGAVMSGSGSAVAGLFAGECDARRCLSRLREIQSEVYLAKPLREGARIIDPA